MRIQEPAFIVLDIANLFMIAPANDAVEYYVGEFSDSNDPHGKYVGEPRPSLEKAWEDLLGRELNPVSTHLVEHQLTFQP